MLLAAARPARAQLVVSQFFPAAGQNALAPNGDFVEIFNRSCVTVPLSQYTVRLATSISANTWTTITLPNVLLDPGQYYCIRLYTAGAGVAYTADLDAAVGDIMQPSGGKVAIVYGATPFAAGTNCPAAALIVDLFAYATSGGVCTESSRFVTAAPLSAGRGFQRNLDGCQDTNVNTADFTSSVTPPTPRTLTTGSTSCASPATYGSCTLADQSCRAVAGLAACTALGGTYGGDCVACAIPQACCLPTPPATTCQLLTSAQCAAQGGILSDGQLSCPPTPACQALGRCCAPDGSCTLTFAEGCLAPNVHGGPGTSCGSACSGRCCLPNGDCVLTGASNCAGQFAGLGTTCSGAYDLTSIPLSFEDISGTGTDVAGADNTDDGTSTGAVPIGFNFSFFDGVYSTVNINNNGILVFDPITGFTTYQNVPLPANGAAVPNNAIYPLWDDLDTRRTIYPAASLKTQTVGPPGNQIFIVQWTSAPQYNGGAASTDVNTFQVKLFEGTNVIEFHYQTVGLEAAPDTFPGTVIGIEDATGTSAVQFDAMDTCRAALNGGNTALRFAPAALCTPVSGCTCRGDLNGDSLVNGRDIRGFAACVVSGGAGCDCADVNQSGSATAADVAPFVAKVLSGACP